MKIAFLLTQSLDSPSGLGRFGPIARQLARSGHQVEIFALHPDWSSLKHNQFLDAGVQVVYVSQMHLSKKGSHKYYFNTRKLIWIALVATLRLAVALWKSKADVIQICKPHPMNSLAALIAARGRRITCDCDDYEAGVGNFSNRWTQRVVAWFEKHIPLRAQWVTTNTYFMRDQLISWGVPEDKIVYLPNGVDRKRFNIQDPQKIVDLRQKLELENKHVIAYIGTIGLASHAVDVLLESFAILHKEMPDSVLMLVGGGEDMESLQSFSRTRGLDEAIRWVGKVPQETVPLYYRLADVTVDPVRDDDAARGRSPLKLFESWACGVPFVSADVGDRKLLLGNPPAGLLCQPGDPQSLASAILHLLQNPDDRSRISTLGWDRVQSYYWDRLSAIIEGIYKGYTQNP